MIYLSTPYGDRYHIHPNGNIQRLDQEDFVPSDKWKMLGIIPVIMEAAGFIPLAELTRERIAGLNLLYKNGKPRYTVVDLDHGIYDLRHVGGQDG